MMNTARQSPDHIAEASQLMYAAARKRTSEVQPSYMQLMLERQAPKRMKTENVQNISSDLFTKYLKQQADIRARAGAPAGSLTSMPTMDRASNSLSMSSNSFLVDRMARQSSASPGLYDAFQGLPSRNDTSVSMASGLGHLMPSFGNNDVGFGGQLASFTNSGGLMMDSSSGVSARQRLSFNGMTGASMMTGSTGRSSFSMQSRGEQSLLLEAAALNNFQGAMRNTQRNSMLSSSLSHADQAFLHGLLDSPTSGLTSQTSSFPVGMTFQGQFCPNVGSGASPLPMVLARPEEDNRKLSEMQVFLREQIEIFEATQDDVTTHTRGRNKPIRLGQVGIRCKHCAHLPVVQRQKGSTYFPATLLGLYQAAQNQLTTHMQSGLCREMPEEVKAKFAEFQLNKVTSSGAGRPYWAHSAKKLGLVDTPEDGIRHISSIGRPF